MQPQQQSMPLTFPGWVRLIPPCSQMSPTGHAAAQTFPAWPSLQHIRIRPQGEPTQVQWVCLACEALATEGQHRLLQKSDMN